MIHGSPTCPYGQYKTPISGYFNIGSDGSLLTSSSLNASFLNYCLDFFITAPLNSGNFEKRAVSSNLHPQSLNHKNGLAVEKIEEEKPEIQTETTRPQSILKAIMCFESPSDAMNKKRNNAGLISVPRTMSIIYGVAFVFSAICIALAGFVSLCCL